MFLDHGGGLDPDFLAVKPPIPFPDQDQPDDATYMNQLEAMISDYIEAWDDYYGRVDVQPPTTEKAPSRSTKSSPAPKTKGTHAAAGRPLPDGVRHDLEERQVIPKKDKLSHVVAVFGCKHDNTHFIRDPLNPAKEITNALGCNSDLLGAGATVFPSQTNNIALCIRLIYQ